MHHNDVVCGVLFCLEHHNIAMADIHHDLLVETIRFLDKEHFKDIQRHDNPAGSLRYKIDRVLNYNEVDLKRINEKLTNYIDVERRLRQRGHI